jgi:hypothetical protein
MCVEALDAYKQHPATTPHSWQHYCPETKFRLECGNQNMMAVKAKYELNVLLTM